MQRTAGFTLIELMITVAVIAILAAIALPNYSEYVTRSRITGATSALAEMRVRMEQYFQDNRTYVGACTAGTVAAPPANTSTFTFTCPTITATTYEVVATGVGSMTGFDYRITQARRSTRGLPPGWNGAGAGSTCWVTQRSGTC